MYSPFPVFRKKVKFSYNNNIEGNGAFVNYYGFLVSIFWIFGVTVQIGRCILAAGTPDEGRRPGLRLRLQNA